MLRDLKHRGFYAAGTLAAALSLTLSACGGSSGGSGSNNNASGGGATAGSSASPTQSVDTTPVKLAFSDTPDVGDITVLAAMKMMRDAGYNISSQIMNGNAVNASAVASGNAQIGNLSAATLFQAINHGQPFVLFAQSDDNEFALVTPSSIANVQQLNGKTVGLASPDTSTAALTAYTEKTNHVTFKIAYTQSSTARAAALLAGQLQGTPLELDDVAKILNGSGNKFHVLINYGQALPWLLSNVLYTTKSFASAHPTLMQTLVDDLNAADQQAYSDPNGFLQKYASVIQGYTMAILKTTMTQSVAGKIWGDSSAIPVNNVNRTLDFDQQQGKLTAAQVGQLKSSESSWIKALTPKQS